MKKFLSLAVFASAALATSAQNSVIYKADALTAEGKHKEALEQLESALTHPKTTKFGEIYHKAGAAVGQLFNVELSKASANVPFDTLNFVNRLDQMVDYFTKSYTAEHTPNAEGKMPKAKFDTANERMMLSAKDYYFYAGIFMNSNKKPSEARQYFKKHLELPNNPVLAAKRDSLLKAGADNYATTAYYMTMLSYQQKKWDEVLESVDAAMASKKNLRDLYVMKLQALMDGKQDTAAYVATLKSAIANLEDNANFINNLAGIYYETNNLPEAERMAKEFVTSEPNNKNAWYVKGVVELNMKSDYKAARESFTKALSIDPNFVEANTNMAYTYINEVAKNRMSGKYKYVGTDVRKVTGNAAVAKYNQELKEVQDSYKQARTYMEKVRTLLPEEPRRWASALQQIYSNLNLKKEAKEMDDLIEATRRH